MWAKFTGEGGKAVAVNLAMVEVMTQPANGVLLLWMRGGKLEVRGDFAALFEQLQELENVPLVSVPVEP